MIYEITKIQSHYDERGVFAELMRCDWTSIICSDEIKQTNLSISYPGIIRAWHKHVNDQFDYLLCIKGCIKVCIFEEEQSKLQEIVSNGQSLQIVKVNGKYWHGFKVLGNEPAILVYFTSKLYDYNHPDEERRIWNDPTVIPQTINGKTNDPRVGKSWDWNYPPHK